MLSEFSEYKRKADEFLKGFDFKQLEQIKLKPIAELTQEDFEFIGFVKIEDPDEIFPELYNFVNLDNSKLYLGKSAEGSFHKLGFRLREEKVISTTQELIDDYLLNWKLRLNETETDLKS